MAIEPGVRIRDDSRLIISSFGSFSMARASFGAANVMVLSLRSIIRKLGFCTNAPANASIPGGRIPFWGTRITSNVPIVYDGATSRAGIEKEGIVCLLQMPWLTLEHLHFQDDFDRQRTVSKWISVHRHQDYSYGRQATLPLITRRRNLNRITQTYENSLFLHQCPCHSYSDEALPV